MDLVFNNIPDQNKETYLLSPILFDSTLITIKPKEFFSYDNIMERGFSIPINRWENVLKQNLFVYKLPKGFKFPKNIKMMSDEKKEIAKFYNQYLKRRPHQSELDYWEKQVIEAHFNYDQIENCIQGNAEASKPRILLKDIWRDTKNGNEAGRKEYYPCCPLLIFNFVHTLEFSIDER